MPNYLFRALILILIAVFAYGCETTKDVKVRAYKRDKQRVDQVIEGKSGNWQGAPDSMEAENRKKTRKIYVLEFTKSLVEFPDGENDFVKRMTTMPPESMLESPLEMKDDFELQSQFNIPSFDIDSAELVENTNESTRFVEYKVEKDDTLQKISKKFYDSYSKWPKIYEANKSVIKNPDNIKPGITIRIPM